MKISDIQPPGLGHSKCLQIEVGLFWVLCAGSPQKPPRPCSQSWIKGGSAGSHSVTNAQEVLNSPWNHLQVTVPANSGSLTWVNSSADVVKSLLKENSSDLKHCLPSPINHCHWVFSGRTHSLHSDFLSGRYSY